MSKAAQKPKQPTKRERVLSAIRFAAYHGHNEVKAWLNTIDGGSRLVSYEAFREAARQGVAARKRGVGCNCFECKNGAKS